MGFIYNLLVHLTWWLLHVAALFNNKLSLFVSGRKATFKTLRSTIKKDDHVVWVHVASLGEFEQGLPVLEKIRTHFPDHKILLTFFSPSGYEVKKNTTAADVVVYLPMDTKTNARRFLSIVNPKLALFIKYEIWPNYLNALKKRNTPTLLVSALFKKDQVYFKPYGGFMRQALKSFDHYFVQNEGSKQLLATVGITEVTVSGDTRFDRVAEILERDNQLAFMDSFKGNSPCFIAGSTWPEDEKILISFINGSNDNLKYVFAPHTIKKEPIEALKAALQKRTVCYSELHESGLDQYDVLIIDTIGLLTKIYSYADIAYVGGGFATGLHNTLEPAVFGIPVLIGPQYDGFREVEELVEKGGVLSVKNKEEFEQLLKRLLGDPEFLGKVGAINKKYITENKGATTPVMAYLEQIL